MKVYFTGFSTVTITLTINLFVSFLCVFVASFRRVFLTLFVFSTETSWICWHSSSPRQVHFKMMPSQFCSQHQVNIQVNFTFQPSELFATQFIGMAFCSGLCFHLRTGTFGDVLCRRVEPLRCPPQPRMLRRFCAWDRESLHEFKNIQVNQVKKFASTQNLQIYWRTAGSPLDNRSVRRFSILCILSFVAFSISFFFFFSSDVCVLSFSFYFHFRLRH